MSKILPSIVPLLEQQGVVVSELSDRQLKFNVEPERAQSAGADIGFIRNGTVVAVRRGETFLLGYYVTVSTPNWPATIIGAALFVVLLVATWPSYGIGCSLSLPLPVVSLAALGDRAARQRRVRRLLADAVDTIPGIDC